PSQQVLAEGRVHMRLEGGEEDSTPRPANLPPHVSRLLKAGETEQAMRLLDLYRNGRKAEIKRDTAETQIQLGLNLEGTGQAQLSTGVGFFDHMLTLLARHSLIDLTIEAKGDLHVDAHHTVEDVGICLGKALAEALGDKAGVRRYGDATVPMDETLVTAAVDLSGRPFCVWKAEGSAETLGTFNSQLGEEFWRGGVAGGGVGGGADAARRAAPRTQHAPHHRGRLQGDGPGSARRRRTRSAGARRAVDQGRAVSGWRRTARKLLLSPWFVIPVSRARR